MNKSILDIVVTIVLVLVTSILIPTVDFVYNLDKRVFMNSYKIEQIEQKL